MNEIPSAGEVFRGDDGTVSTILPSNYGQDYEASDGELDEYAEYIGIDPAKEPELMWIAREGLRASLPDGWRACQTDENEVYYFNFQTGESLWDHPMDEHYKTKVTNERAKRRGGGGGGGAVGGGAAAETMPLRTAPAAAPVGATKAIAESFFLKPAATASLTRLPGSLPNPAATSALLAGAAASEGASLPRAPPDVSDILSLAGSRGPSTSTPGASGVARFRESEAALRKRLEEENGLQLRNLRIELEKKADAERQRLAEAKTKLQSDLDHSWEAEKAGGTPSSSPTTAGGAAGSATQRRLQLAREVKQIEESWKTRLHDVAARVRELQQAVEAKQQSMQSTLQQTPEDLRRTLEARNAAELAQLRETKKKESEVALSQLRSEQALALTEARRRANDAVAAAGKLGEAEMEKRAQERRAQNAAMLTALQTALTAKQADLAEREAKAAAAPAAVTPQPTSSSPSPAAPPAGPSREDEAAVVAAQAAADADVAAAKRASAAATTRLREEYAAKKAEKEAALRAAQQQQQAAPRPLSRTSTVNSAITSPTSGAPTPRSGSGFGGSSGVISQADQTLLNEEDRKLREEADRAARVYEEETQLMVANKAAGRPLAAAPLPDVAARVSAEAVASLARSAAQEHRARDAENTRHTMVMKQLETKHEQAVRAIKAQQDKALAAAATAGNTNGGAAGAAGFNPRQHPSFATELTARKQAWLRENPAPTVEMPTLPPVPTLPVATMQSDMAAVPVPDAAEQAALLKTRLSQLRAALQRQYDGEAQALQQGRERGLEEWRAAYRATRLAEVETAVAALRAEAAAAAAAKASAQREQAAAVAAAEAAKAAEASTFAALQRQRAALESSIAEADGAHERQVQAMQARLADVEASLAELQAQEQREETAKVRLRLQQQQPQQRQAAQANVSAADTAAASVDPVVYIADAEAAGAEAALRTRWATLLAALRNAVQREMDAYERALEESSSIAASTAARAPSSAATRAGVSGPSVSTPRERGTAFGGGPSSLPPTAPPAAAMAAMTAPGQGGGDPQLASHPALQAASGSWSGFTTPLQRPPREDSVAGLTVPMGGAAGAFSGPPLYLSDTRLCPAAAAGGVAGALPVQRVLLSPSPQPQLWPGAGAAAAHGRHADPLLRWSVPSGQGRWAMPALGFRGGSLDAASSGSALQPPPPPPLSPHGRAGGGGVDDEDAEAARARRHAAHLSALQQTVRARRRALQAQRLEMEELRAEWRADMHACKQHGDRAQAQQLRAVKEELEVRARTLNEEVMQLKEMQERVHEEVRRFRQWTQLRQQQLGVPPDDFSGRRTRGGDGLAAAEARPRAWSAVDTSAGSLFAPHGDWAASLHAAGPADVVSLLQSVMDRTERLEEMLLLSRLASHSSSSPAAP